MENNEFLTKEYETLNLSSFQFCIEDANFVCLTDKYFKKAHSVPQMKQLEHLHTHPYYELFFVEKGPFLIKFNNTEITLNDNDAIIISPDTPHRSFILSNGVLRYNLNFYTEKISAKTDFSLYHALVSALSKPYILFRHATSLFEPIKKLSECIRIYDPLFFSTYFHSLVALLISAQSVSASTTQIVSDINISRIYKIQHIINLHYMDDISISDIAKILFLSVRQVTRLIRKHYHCSFGELITNLRMNAAADFLRTTDMNILDIASWVGYNSLSTFYTTFKKHYGCPPVSYRKNHKN